MIIIISGKKNLNLTNHLNELVQNPERRDAFVKSVEQDISQAQKLLKGSNRSMAGLDAAYHCRKHGPEFGVEPKVYFKDIPAELFKPENCTSQYVAKVGFLLYSCFLINQFLGWNIDLFNVFVHESRQFVQTSVWCVVNRY